jgi:hypothetical protein
MEDLYKHAKLVLARKNVPLPTEYLKIIQKVLLAERSIGNCPVTPVYVGFVVAAVLLYRREHFDYITPPPEFADPIEVARYRDLIKKEIQRLEVVEELIAAFTAEMVQLFSDFTDGLPLIAIQTSAPKEEASTTVPLIDVIDVRETVATLMRPFIQKRPDIFESMQEVLLVNYMEATGIRSFADYKGGKLIGPREFKGTPAQIANAYLKNTPFDEILDVQIPFSIPQETRFSGHWIIAPPGRGKTTLLHHMFLEDLPRDASIIVMDSKGDLINPIKELKAVQDRLVLIEPDADFPLALNPLDIPSSDIEHTIALIEYVFSSLLDAKFTPLQMTLFRHVLPAIIQCIPNPTLTHFRDIIASGPKKYGNYFSNLDPELQEFFDTQFDSETYKGTRTQLIWRLDFLRTNRLMRAMFDAPKTKLDLGKEMDAGKIIVINNSKALLGEEGAEFFGRFFIALVLSAAQQRSGRRPADKLPCYFYIDECQNVIKQDEKVPTILDECRSQKIGLILAHQRTAQIISANVLSALSNCAIRMANSDEEAKKLAPDLRTTPEFLQSLPVGKFAAYVRDYTQHALALDIPYHDMRKLPRMTAGEQSALREKMRVQYANPKALPAPRAEPQEAQPRQPQPRHPQDEDLTKPKKGW